MDELDELVGLFGNDAGTIRQALANNPAAAAALQSRQTVYNTFVSGDQGGLTAAVTQAQQQQQQRQPQQDTARQAAFDLDSISAELDSRVTSRMKTFTESNDFTNMVNTRAQAIAEDIVKKSTGDIIGRAAKLSDEIYSVRSAHSREFGSELDTKAFEQFLEGKQFGSISAAHDVFVQEERVNKRIAEGIRTGVQNHTTGQVPGTSLPTSQSPLGAMMRANPANAASESRGAGLDAAIAAFRATPSGGGGR